MNKVFVLVLSLSVMLFSCSDDVIVKPAAKLRLEYPSPRYTLSEIDCPFSFSRNSRSNLVVKPDCAVNVVYPEMKATVYLTYRSVSQAKLNSLLSDAQKLTYDHTIKANEIFEQPRVDSVNRVYGMFYMINGDAATQSQFYVTDSTDHFISGSLYFESKPNFDSIYPAVVYLRNDIRRIMETIQWE